MWQKIKKVLRIIVLLFFIVSLGYLLWSIVILFRPSTQGSGWIGIAIFVPITGILGAVFILLNRGNKKTNV